MKAIDKNTFESQDLASIREYLKTSEGKNAIKEVMKKPGVQKTLHSIESSGYKAVHTQFQDRFKAVNWETKSDNKTRASEIKNNNNEVVANLCETTKKAAPPSVMLDDGSVRTVKSYRQIDFPKALEAGTGPLHVSMAVKDENGKNIAAKDAVYFTAHYNDNGKLTEVSSPIPVKFMGEDKDAIGYIERDGKVFTLPVTQGKYQEMMKEVAINNGIGINTGQQVKEEELAQDKMYTANKQSKIPQNLQQQAQQIGTVAQHISKNNQKASVKLTKTNKNIGRL